MHIIVYGSIAFDRVMIFPGTFQEHILPNQIHNLNVSFFIERLEQRRGGCAGNIAYSLKLLGEQPQLVGSVGGDADSYIQYWQQLGLSTEYIALHSNESTAGAYMMTDLKNNQISGFHPGADSCDTALQLEAYDPKETVMIFSPRNNKNEILRYVQRCQQLGIRYIFDLGQTIPTFSGEELRMMMKGAYIIIVNDYELNLILHRAEVTKEEVLTFTEKLITTLGDHGSVIESETDRIEIPICRVEEVKDPTGAGDAYRAGLLKGLSAGCSWEQAGKLGAVAAAYAIEHYGTQEHGYTLAEFAQRYQENFNKSFPLTVN